MPKIGPVRIPDPQPQKRKHRFKPKDPEDVILPPRQVLEAGLAKFKEMAGLHWPSKDGSYAFDVKNAGQMMITLGLVYMSMKDAERRLVRHQESVHA